MTRCDNCRSNVRAATARIYVSPDEIAIVLCLRCRTTKPRNRQYSPRSLPKQSRTPIDGGRSP